MTQLLEWFSRLEMSLRGVCMRYVACPDPEARFDPVEMVIIPQDEAAKAVEEFLKHGLKIKLDRHLVNYTHYGLKQLLACQAASVAWS